MNENLLSPLHIQKLGHPIEEIRNRALLSIISKYNLNLVDENNLENTKLLLQKLFEWFDFDKCSQEKKVLNLILKILKYKNAYLILKEPELNEISKKLNDIKKSLGSVYFSKIEEIIEVIKNIKEQSKEICLENFKTLDYISKNVVELNLGNNYKNEKNFENKNDFTDDSICILENSPVERLRTDFKDTKKIIVTSPENFFRDCIYKIEYFPWQNLVPNDKQVIASVFHGLKYIDENNSILQSCQFFNEVVLRDFPAEIFIQRPLIIRTFLELLDAVRGEVKIAVLKCIMQTVQNLNKKIKLISNPSLFNQKKEFYTTSVFPENSNSEFCQSELINACENLNYSLSLNNEYQKTNDFESCLKEDDNIKKYQLTVQEFYFEVLIKILSQLDKNSTRKEANYILELSFKTITGLINNLKCNIWRDKNGLKNKFYKIFVMLQELLKLNKIDNKVIYIIILNFIVNLLNSLKPPSILELAEILPRGLHIELGQSILDFVVVLMFPSLHKQVLHYVEFLETQKEKEYIQYYKEVLIIFKSMKSAIYFLKHKEKFKNKMEKLQCIYEALNCLDFHQNFEFIYGFFHSCLLKWCKSELQEEEIKFRQKILLKLMAHSEDSIKISIYKEISKNAVKLLGEEEATKPKYEFPGDKIEFLFHSDVLIEIICHGLTSELEEVKNSSNEILIYLLRSKFLMSENCWNNFLKNLTPCLSLLQCHADKSSKLGRCIVKLFDPDVAISTGLPEIEILKGNMRFLFSKDNLIRDEAVSRLFWLLGKEDVEKKKLPRLSIITGLNLSGICSSVEPKNYENIHQSFYSPGKLCDVVEMLTSKTVEPNVRRSALSQLCVMLEDNHLHSTFLEQKGLKSILHILENCLIERQYNNYPDSVMPIIEILKLLSSENVCVRQELSEKIDVFYNVIRGLFLFSSDERLRRNAAELLCLLLYSDCILKVPTDKSIKCTISFPEIVVKKICLPFSTHVYLRSSRHFEPSVKKTLLSNESCSKLLRVYWAIQWSGSLTDLLGIEESDLKNKNYFSGIADDLKINQDDITCLKRCSFSCSIKQTLYNIQNATTHETAYFGFCKLHRFRLLYDINKATFGRGCNDVCSDAVASHLHWESTFERFMLHTPFCIQDESLLLEVIQFLKKVFKSFSSNRLIDWTEKLLTDQHKPLFGILKNLGNENCGLKGRELRLSIIELAQHIIVFKPNPNPSKWFMYMELISNLLKLDKTKEFYNVAYVDWIIGFLVDLTGKCRWCFSDKINFLKSLINRIMEIIIAFHCTYDSAVSFMGINIIKNSILVLNHILTDSLTYIKNWEEVWFQALSSVIGHENLNYCWLLSLLYMRDSVIRASAYQLFVGFTSTSKACKILMEQLNIPCEQVWTQAIKVLFDEKESCLIREKCGLLLSNLVWHKNKKSGSLLEYLNNLNFFSNVLEIISNFHGDCEKTIPLMLDKTNNIFLGQIQPTPGLIISLSCLLQSIIYYNSTEACNVILETGILESLTKVLGEIPVSSSSCENHTESIDIINMYISVCRLITICITVCRKAQSLLLQSYCCINYLFAMINYNLYCKTSQTIISLQRELWCQIFQLFTALLMDFSDEEKSTNKEHSGFFAINNCITQNGIDHFISSVYIAVTSDLLELRTAVLQFLINLFRSEMETSAASIKDIFDRKISMESVEISRRLSHKELFITQNLNLEFSVRLADIIMQIFLLGSGNFDFGSRNNKNLVANALGSLFGVNRTAQNYCLDKELGGFLIEILKKICVKLSLENVNNLKKLSDKKKIGRFLASLETLFQLITNLAFNNEKVKIDIADRGLSVVCHKLWPWCVCEPSLLIVTLKMLCTFTSNCDQSCRSMTMSSNFSVISLKKSPGSITLMNAVANQVPEEMELISKNHDNQILCLCLQLLSNCCRVAECRSVIPKGNFLLSFTKLDTNKKKRPYCSNIVDSWLKFFVSFSSHQEGQIVLCKNQDVLDAIMVIAATKANHRVDALTILRNICFNHSNRFPMLRNSSFLSLLLTVLDFDKTEEIQPAVVALWALASNSQRAKLILRSAKLDEKLETAKRNFILSNDDETVNLIETVIKIFKNR